ncbi:hypothetical protein BH18ACT4_BH18ACT4_09980 [soil metagenome]
MAGEVPEEHAGATPDVEHPAARWQAGQYLAEHHWVFGMPVQGRLGLVEGLVAAKRGRAHVDTVALANASR